MTPHFVFLAGLCSIVFALLPLADRIRDRWKPGPTGRRLSHLGAFGLMVVLGSLLRHQLAPGVTLAAHVPAITAATIGFGPWVGAGTALIAMVARLATHEAGFRVAELAVHFVFAALLARAWRRPTGRWGPHLLLLAVAGIGNGAIGVLALATTSPTPVGDRPGESLTTDIFLAYTLGTVLLGGFVFLQQGWRRDHALLGGALETTPDAFNLVDDSGRILEVNPGMVALTGYSRAELIGKFLYELRPRETPEEMAASLATIRARGSWRFETRWRRKDGTEIDLEVTASVAPRDLGGFYAFLRDVTERKATEQRLRLQDARLRLGLEAADMFTWEYDPSQGCVHYSDNLPTVTGNPLAPSSETLDDVLDRIHPEDRPRVREALDRTLSEGTPFECDYRLRLSDGSWRWLLSKGRPAPGSPTRPGSILGISIDVTRRQEDAARLRLQETRLRLALDSANMVTWELDPATSSIRYSDNLAAVSGSPDTSPFQSLDSFLQQVHPEDRDRTLAAVDATITRGQPFECDYRVRLGDGSWRWLLGKGRSVTPAGVGERRILGVAIDITERRNAEDAARRWRQLFENAEFGLAAVNVTDNTFIEVNAAFARQRGYTPAELTGQPTRTIIAPESRPDTSHQRQFADVAGHHVFESVHLRKDGSRFPVLMEVTTIRAPDGRPVSRVACALDITDRKRIEAEALAGRAKLAAALESMTDAVFISDTEGRFVDFNEASALFHRFKSKDDCARTLAEYPAFLEVSLPDGNPAPLEQWPVPRALRGESGANVEFRLHRRDTGDSWIGTYSYAPIRDTAGRIVGSVVTARDITEQLRQQQALRESEARYRLIAESTTDVIWLYDLKAGGFTYASPAVQQMLGYAPAELRQHSLAAVLTPESYRQASDRLTERIARFEAGDDSVRTQTHQVDQIRRDGRAVPTEVVSTLIADESRRVTHLQGVTRDITERRRAEAALRESLFFRREAERIGRIGAWKVNPRRNFLRWTEGVHELLEVPLDYRPGLEEGLGFYDPAGLPALREALDNALEHGTGFTLEVGVTTRTGRHLWTEVRGLRRLEEDGEAFIMGTFLDITERKTAEQALREKEERLRLALDASGQGLYDLNVQTGVAVVNDEYARMLGCDPAGFHETNAAWNDRLHPEDREPIAKAYQDYVTGRAPSYRVECRQRSASGDWIWLQSIGRIVSRDAAGQPLRMLGTHLDITERKRAEDRSRRLRDLGLVVAGTADRDRALQLCLEAALDIAGVEAGGIYLVDAATGDLELVCHSGLSEAFVHAVRHFAADAPNALWARQGRFFHGSVDLLRLPSSASERAEGLKAISLLPILDHGRLVALLNIASHRIEEVPAPARMALESVANTVGSLLQRMLAQEALQRAYADLEQRVADRTRDLSRSEERFRRLFELSPLPMGLANARGEITVLNARHRQTFGYTRNEIPTLEDWWERAYPTPEYRHRVLAQWDTALAGARDGQADVTPQEVRITCRDGSTRDVLVSGIQLGEDTLATFLDITQLRKADAMLRTLRRAMEQGPIVVVITDRAGTIEYANPQFETQTGYPVDEAIGRNPRILKSGIHPPEFYRHLWKTIRSGETWRGEFCNRRKDGSLFWESTAIAPIHDAEGTLTHYVAIKEDITERRRIAEELRQARDAAEAANQAKSRFLANMSHEIRTPMNAILGFTQLMLRDAEISASHQKHLATINRSGEYLLRLINDVLDMSKIEAGRMRIAPADFNFHSLIEDLDALFRLRADEKGLAFVVERASNVPARLHADAGRIRQVLVNLLGNAVKFTDHGTVTLQITVGPSPAPSAPSDHPDCRLLLDVKDTGPGIAPEELGRLFEPFEQAGAAQRHGGTGLGLAISLHLARLMGGEISATSEPGAGSVFRFTFVASVLEDPALLAHPAPSPTHRIRRLPADQPPPAVLVVDDIASNRELLRALLEDVGFTVHEAENGAEAVDFCQTLRPDLVLMDRRMPVLDGFAATRAIRALPQGSVPRILMVTASVLGRAEEEWRAAGADGFIGKPVHHDELLGAIGQLLQLRYVEEDSAPTPCTPATVHAGVDALPAELRAQLLDATESGDISRLRELVTRQVLPLDRHLAECLRESVAAYDYTTLLGLLRPPSP